MMQEKRENMGQYAGMENRKDGSPHGWSMDRKYYKDPDIYEQEKDKIFYKSWTFAGHVSQIPNVGDYFLFKLLDESAIIVHTKEGVKAYYNVCRHRGSHICLEDNGNVKRFTCPYHAWTYKLDGSLLTARNMPEEFDKDAHALHPVALEVIHGMIYVNFSDNPSSLEDAKRDLKGPLETYDFAGMKVAAHQNYQIDANWKITLENYQECYHCSPSHPEYADYHTLTVDPDRFDDLQKPMLDRMPSCGLPNWEIDAQFEKNKQDSGKCQYGYSRYALFEGIKTGSKDGIPVAPLLGNLKGYDGGCSDLSIGPFSYMLIYNDHVVVYVFTPTGHETSQCDMYWLVRGDAVEGKDYNLEDLKWLWHVTILADEKIIIDNQKGVNSHKYQPGLLAEMEFLIDRYITWYLNKMITD